MAKTITCHYSQKTEVHHTTLAELHRDAIRRVKTAYESLPNRDTLEFELLTQDDISALFPANVDVVEARLVLGYQRKTYNSERAAVYAYICRKDHISKAILRLGDVPLRVAMLDDVDFIAPFDRVYDVYGMTDRANDRICTMAAYYYLAAEYVDEIITRLDFGRIFADVCSRIYNPVQEGIELTNNGPYVGLNGRMAGTIPLPDASLSAGDRPLANREMESVAVACNQTVYKRFGGQSIANKRNVSTEHLDYAWVNTNGHMLDTADSKRSRSRIPYKTNAFANLVRNFEQLKIANETLNLAFENSAIALEDLQVEQSANLNHHLNLPTLLEASHIREGQAIARAQKANKEVRAKEEELSRLQSLLDETRVQYEEVSIQASEDRDAYYQRDGECTALRVELEKAITKEHRARSDVAVACRMLEIQREKANGTRLTLQQVDEATTMIAYPHLASKKDNTNLRVEQHTLQADVEKSRSKNGHVPSSNKQLHLDPRAYSPEDDTPTLQPTSPTNEANTQRADYTTLQEREARLRKGTPDGTHEHNERLHDRIEHLEHEVQDANMKFASYRREIQAFCQC